VPIFESWSRWGYLFKKPQVFIALDLSLLNAYSNTKLDDNVYSIKAPGFK
jgi:hypothetical protein